MWKGHRLRYSWRSCIAAMRTGEVVLLYVKISDMSLQERRGTLEPSHVPKPRAKPDGERGARKRKANANVVCYWDLDRQAWRCFHKDRLIGCYSISGFTKEKLKEKEKKKKQKENE